MFRPTAWGAVLAASAVALTASLATAQRRAPNPYDVEQRQLAREARRHGRSERAILPILELWSQWEQASPGLTTDLLDDLRRSRRLSAPVRAYAGSLHALALLREGHPDAAARAHDELGFVSQWRIVGPFDNEGKAGFDREMPPEARRDDPVDPGAAWQGRVRPVTWRRYPNITRYGYVNFDAVLRPFENVCGFAETFVFSERARPISVWAGAGGAMKVWLNGEEIIRDDAYRGPDPDRFGAVGVARRGANRLLVKVCVTDAAWGFYLRVAEPDGSPADGLRVDPDGAEQAAAPPEQPPRLPAAPAAPLAAFEQAVSDDEESARAAFELARMLTWTNADDPAERRARQLAERACELDPDVERCLLASGLADERAERMRLLAEAEAVDADDPRVLLSRAAVVMTGPDSDRALEVFDRIRPGTPEWMVAQLGRAGILQSLGLPHASLAALERATSRAPRAPYWMRQRASRLSALGRVEEPLEIRREILEVRWDDFDIRRALVQDALERGDVDEALGHVDAMRAAAPDDLSTMYLAANVYEGLGRVDDALGVHREIIAIVPEEPEVHVSYGQALLRHERRDAAAAALREALALRPQDAATRELLEQIRPTQRPDEAWATSSEEILARRREQSDWPITVLHDLRAHSVFDNGLGSVFRQLAAQIHDAEGARRWRTYSIPFDPSTQWVDVRSARVYRDGRVLESVSTRQRSLGNPSYRIYYDRRALVVVFPDLEPGDVVELRYRVDDIAHRNVFDDYFGDMQILQGGDPIVRLEYVLMTPSSRQLYFNEPELEGLEHERRVEGDRRIDRFVASDVAPIRGESHMPGATEIAPYLHVSTYRTWQDVGEWWWGLIQDQLHMDESLEETVDEVVAGATSTREKVERIFAWVVRNTRYVGLEFGIHGYKPYRVTQIVRRGFGDCKDKASLLYVMLEHAGVDARIVLVRTRRNGSIDELPASLAVFDHAIAYVPELDLYLDGTAENSGSTELPRMDQGVTVLVVGPESAELRETPVLPAERSLRERELVVELAEDGSGTVAAREVVRGDSASHYRTTYQADSTREERLQRAMADTFPGLELLEHSFEDLEDLEEPVRYSYRARVPQMAQRDDGALRVAPSTVEDLTRSLAPTQRRRHPVDLGGRSAYREERTIRVPQGMAVERVPDGGEAESPFGRVAVRYRQTHRQVVVTTDFELTRDRVPVRDYPAFRRWLQRADALLRDRVTLGGDR